ncbi:MAG: LrgB family protein [Lachnospiraceae bacterium]|nr:LrgB family protein [Lachnospiraceae bacterium]
MQNFLSNSVFFGLVLSLAAYGAGLWVKKKFQLAVFNPLLIAIIIVVIVLKLTGIKYSVYNEGAKYISYLLTPATVCLSIPLYRQVSILKKNWKALVAGVVAGVLASMGSVMAMAMFFGITHEQYVTLLPKSITTAIGMGVSEELGGITSITAAVIIITGVIGNIIAVPVCRLFHITEPVAKGIGLGSSAHAIGTVKAFEMGETEGAMSSLSIAVSGLVTVVMASVFAGFY